MKLFRTDQPLTPSWDLVRPSINLVTQNIWPLFYLSFLPSLIALVGLVISGANDANAASTVSNDRMATGLLIAFIGGVASFLAYPGLIYFQVQAVLGKHPAPMEAFKAGLPRIIPFLLMSVVMTFLLVIGFFLLIIPGLIMIRAFLLAPYFVVDEKLGPIEALKKSYEVSKPNAGYLWGTIGVLIVFAFLGSLLGQLPVIGYLLSMAASYIYVFGPVLRYGEIVKNTKIATAKQ